MKNRNKMIYFFSIKKNRKCIRIGKYMLNIFLFLIENEFFKELILLLFFLCFFLLLFDGLKQIIFNYKGKINEKGEIFIMKY